MIWLSEKIEFPPHELASDEGIIALGGDLSPERLLLAYRNGIFPWYSEGEPIIWHSPPRRMVLFPDELRISRSMRQVMKKDEFSITENQAFEDVISQCKQIDRNDGFGTWITNEMEAAYVELHRLGHAKSIEVWKEKELVGGLYGVEMNTVFCGESMFSKISNTSKLALIYLIRSGNYAAIDCQVYSGHLAGLGAGEIDRAAFLEMLKS